MPTTSQRLLSILALAVMLAGCRGGDPSPSSQQADVPDGAAAAVITVDPTPLASMRQAGADELPDASRAVLMDMRIDAKARTADPDGRTSEAVSAALGSQATIVGSLDGAFTRPRSREQAHLADTADGSRWIVILGGQEPLRMDGEGVRYLLASPDIDGNGSNELVLRVDTSQEGVVETDLTVLTFDGDQAATVARFEGARVDGCASADPHLRAHRIEYGRPASGSDWPEFVSIGSQSECVDGAAPDFDGYVGAEQPL